MDEMGILRFFKGVLCHDHWKPYYDYDCTHALCAMPITSENWSEPGNRSAEAVGREMQALLIELATAVTDAGGCLPVGEATRWRRRYRRLLKKAETECPPPDERQRQGKRGRSNDRRPETCWSDCATSSRTSCASWRWRVSPSPTIRVENDLRMTKVQQEKNQVAAAAGGRGKIFCRVRSYLSTCRKQGMTATHALTLLFQGKDPDFWDGRGPK